MTQLEIMPRPPEERPQAQPWPTYPMTYRVSSAHEEGGERMFAVSTQRFVGDDDGHVRSLELSEVEFVDGRFQQVPDSERSIPADAVFLAMGFTGQSKVHCSSSLASRSASAAPSSGRMSTRLQLMESSSRGMRAGANP